MVRCPLLMAGAGEREVTAGSKRASKEGEELDKTPTEFVFFKAFHDESTVGVVSSLVAGIMGNGAEWPGGIPAGRYGDGIIIAPEYTPAANWTEQCQNGTLLKKFSSVRRLKGAFSA